MKPNLKNYFEKFTHTKWLVIILLIGIGLLILPGTFPKNVPSGKEATESLSFSDRKSYEHELESRLAKMLSTVRGISHVSVMITIEDTGEMVYAKNETFDEKNTNDGLLIEKEQQAEGTTALKNDGAGKNVTLVTNDSSMINTFGNVFTIVNPGSAQGSGHGYANFVNGNVFAFGE